MIFYISCRPLRVDNKLITPKEHLKYNFTGVDFTFKPVCWNAPVDGRILYEIDLNSSDTSIRDAIIEGLYMFGCHLKSSVSSAASLASLITGETWVVNGDKIEKSVE
jgi:hypothetical protein